MTTAAHLACLRLGPTPVLWTAWGEDWRHRAPRCVHDTVTRDLTGGSTVLLHDSDSTSATGSWRTTLAALPHIPDSVPGLRAPPASLQTARTRGWSG